MVCAYLRWSCVLLVAFLVVDCLPQLPLCSPNGDTFGRWVDVGLYHNTTEIQNEVAQKFVLGGPAAALNFSQLWIPDNCSVHRFTNDSVHMLVNFMFEKNITTPPFRVIFLGDSATRGLVNGWSRLMAGSELLGPCENDICGKDANLPPSHKNTHQLRNVFFGEDIEASFMYIKTFTDRFSNWMVEGNINKKPHAVVVNTGAWDFDGVARRHIGEVAAEHCNSEEMERVSQIRAQGTIRNYFLEEGDLAKHLGVRAIYRTNHYNTRFGVHCADDRFLAALNGTHWEVWDNTRISKDVWTTTGGDGFHFDRHRVHSYRHHQQLIDWAIEAGKPVPGMLEMQLTQSMLHMLFHDALKAFLDEGRTM